MTTVFDVAKRAGVSSATVSRVLSGKDTVKETTRTRVMEAVNAFGYRPNAMAQGLRLGKARSVALVVGDIEQGVYAALTKHIQAHLEEIRHSLVLFNMQHREDRLSDLLHHAKATGLSAVIVAAPHILSAALEAELDELARSGITAILYGQRLRRCGLPSIVEDDAPLATRAVEHLVRKGHAPVAFLGRISDSALGRERYFGYLEALARNGLAFDPALVWDTTERYRYAAGSEAMGQALDRGLEVAGVLAASDELALGAMAAALDRGLLVPQDIAFIGFGGNPWCEYVRPSLTTVAADTQEAGRLVRDILIAIEEGREPPLASTLPAVLALRESA
ncbi:MAG: LacI family DNA-binding transcriptional regulator [Hyphomicrobiales bacterium]